MIFCTKSHRLKHNYKYNFKVSPDTMVTFSFNVRQNFHR